MSITVRWHDPAQTIVIVKFSDPWTIADLSAAIQDSRRFMNSVDYTVYAVWDGTETSGVPRNVYSHFMLPNEDTDIPANQAAIVVIVNTTFLKSFVAMAKRLLPRITQNMHIANDLAAAEAKIEALRAAR